ncbi:MAG: hypothetical protein ABIY52_10180, partial [Gemmatimonadaceae bacterium]
YLDVNESPALYKDEIVVEGGSSQLVPIAIAKCTGSIAVSVKDQGAQAVAGYPLTLYTAKSVTQDGVTGADGVFRSGVIACDEYGVSLKASAGYVLTPGRGKTFVDGLVVHRGTALSAALTVQSCTATLAVSATDAAGLPVAGARFTLYTASSFLSTLNSDAGGRATFPVPCGQDVGVNVVPPAGYTVTSGRGSSYFDGINLSNGSTAARTFILGRQ